MQQPVCLADRSAVNTLLHRQNMSVSCVTVTCPKRIPFLLLLARCIRHQHAHDKILEWVVVFMTDPFDSTVLDATELRILSGVENVRVIPVEYGNRIGAGRELCNREAQGKVIVVMDDDDIYSPQYIDEILKVMKERKRKFVACDRPYMYDDDTDSWYQWSYSLRTCTNNSFAYTRDFAASHHYNPDDTKAEERAFVGAKDVAYPMAPETSVYQLSHGWNTVNKRQMIVTPDAQAIRRLDARPEGITIPDELWAMYQDVLRITALEAEEEAAEDGPPEIVYYCGLQPQGWDPRSTSLGGSEQAVVQLSTEWVKRGYRVIVYLTMPKNGDSEIVHNGVIYRKCQDFKIRHRRYPRLIVWRKFGYSPLLTKYGHLLTVDKLILDLHDCTCPPSTVMNIPGIHVMVKSRFHNEMFAKKYPDAAYHVIENGVQYDLFKDGTNFAPPWRQPFRFVYTSDYSRGLIPFLEHVWPHIVQRQPRAELHTYYGGETKFPEGVLNVCDHGRRDIEVIAHDKRFQAPFHVYLCTDTNVEIDCIAVKESYLAGCMPIMFNDGVFKERNGVLIPKQEITAETGESIAEHVLQAVEKNYTNGVVYNDDAEIYDWPWIARFWEQEHVL